MRNIPGAPRDSGLFATAVHGPMAAAIPVIASVASAGMTIAGASQQSAAQQAAGTAAYQNALLRNEQIQLQAQQERAAAIAAQAQGQRADIQDQIKGKVMASRATAVMAASGAGVDPKLVANLTGQANYASGVDEYNANEKARVLDNQSALTSWAGNSGVELGEYDKESLDARADNTMTSGIVGAGLSLAAKYGGDLPGVFSGTSSAGSPISADATMAAWNAAPASFTRPGFGPG